YAERRGREHGYAREVWRIPHPAWADPPADRLDELVGDRGPVVGCFGNLNASKRVPQVLEAFAALRKHHPRALLVLGGALGPGIELERRLPELGLRLGEDVHHEGRVPEDRLWALLASCDLVVALRRPTRGETSGMAIRALSLGKPLIVSDAG